MSLKNSLNLKKIRSIIWENILYSFRENLLIWPVIVFILTLLLYWIILSRAVLWYMAEASYIWTMSTIQYVLMIIVLVYITITSFDKDIKSKNIYISLQHTKRKEFFLWKLISNILLLFLLNIVQMFVMLIWFFLLFKKISFDIVYIFMFQQLEVMILVFILSLITMLISKNIMRVIWFIIVFILWHSLFFLREMLITGELVLPETIKNTLLWLYYIVPNLEAFNVKNSILIDNNVLGMFWTSSLYLLLQMTIFYIIWLFLLNKKDF